MLLFVPMYWNRVGFAIECIMCMCRQMSRVMITRNKRRIFKGVYSSSLVGYTFEMVRSCAPIHTGNARIPTQCPATLILRIEMTVSYCPADHTYSFPQLRCCDMTVTRAGPADRSCPAWTRVIPLTGVSRLALRGCVLRRDEVEKAVRVGEVSTRVCKCTAKGRASTMVSRSSIGSSALSCSSLDIRLSTAPMARGESKRR